MLIISIAFQLKYNLISSHNGSIAVNVEAYQVWESCRSKLLSTSFIAHGAVAKKNTGVDSKSRPLLDVGVKQFCDFL